MSHKIGLGGSCHWCTEAIFQSLRGVTRVEQGWLSALPPDDVLAEGVVVYFDADVIDLKKLIEIHLHTHSCTSNHKMRSKYRSAVYCYNQDQFDSAVKGLSELQNDFEQGLVTRALHVVNFQMNQPRYLDYYNTDPSRPFCRTRIEPKLARLLELFSDQVN